MTRCLCAGSTGWAARRSSPRTPKIAGPPTGWPGTDSTASGPTSRATCCRFDRATGDVVASYRSADPDGSQELPDVYVLGPEGFRAVAKMERIAAGVYEARAKVGERYGMFRFRPASELQRFPESGYYRENLELEVYGSNPALLEAVANATGGRVNPAPADVFLNDDRAVDETFHDVDTLAARCRFADCAHEREPGCAVRAAVESGALARDRYESYQKLQREYAALAERRRERERRLPARGRRPGRKRD